MAVEKNTDKIPDVPAKENPGHSTQETPGITGNRTETERRVGSGNTRSGAAEARQAADETGD